LRVKLVTKQSGSDGVRKENTRSELEFFERREERGFSCIKLRNRVSGNATLHPNNIFETVVQTVSLGAITDHICSNIHVDLETITEGDILEIRAVIRSEAQRDNIVQDAVVGGVQGRGDVIESVIHVDPEVTIEEIHHREKSMKIIPPGTIFHWIGGKLGRGGWGSAGLQDIAVDTCG